ncbi:MAG: mRNA surveillance protein pelota [Candidatus Bathyarchaeia archaeon]
MLPGVAVRVLARDPKHGRIKVVPESLDDLWHLFHIVRRGDVVHARTTREVKVGGGEDTPSEKHRFPMNLSLRVEALELDRYVRRLRIRGVVLEAPEKFQGVEGNYHTFNIKTGEPIVIIKEEWPNYDLERLQEAVKSFRPRLLIVAMDDEDFCVAGLREFGVETMAEWHVEPAGKAQPAQREASRAAYFEKALASLEEALNGDPGVILIVGPGFVKQEFKDYLSARRPRLADAIRLGSVSVGGSAGVNEALRAGLITRYASEARAVLETKLVEEAFLRLSREDGRIAYGKEVVEQAVEYGAVERLLISDRLLRSVTEEEWLSLRKLMEAVEKRGGETAIISSETEAGEKLYSIGGLVAVLRWRV